MSSVILKAEDGSVVNQKLKDHLIPSWKKALLANEDPTRNAFQTFYNLLCLKIT